RAVTDSIGVVRYSDEQPGIKNLIEIYSAFSKDSIEDIEKRYEGLGYGKFKEDLAEVIIEGLKPIQKKFNSYMKNKDYLESVYKQGAEKARYISNKTLRKVYRKIGFIIN